MGLPLFPPRRLLGAAVLAALALHGGGAAAVGLVQAYEAARLNDPEYKAAYYENEGGKEYRKLGLSGLLPTVSANYSLSQNRTDIEGKNVLGQETLTHPKYLSRVKSVSVRQTVFNLDALARYKQGVAQTNYAAYTFLSRGQELVLRLAGSYFDAAFASDQVALARAQRDMYAEQKNVNDRLFRDGEGTKTDMLETQARLDLSEAQLVEALDNERISRETLAAVVGEPVAALDQLGERFRVLPLQPAAYDDWQALALKNNPDLEAQTYAIEAARQEINKGRAGHAPRLDLVGSYSQNDSETINTYNENSTVRAIGFQVTIPLYSGGAVNASTRQAVAGHEKAKADLEDKTAKVLIELRKEYSLTQSSVAKLEALGKAVASGQLLVDATRQSIAGGVRINLDLLNAQQQLFVSRRDLAQARYGYLLALLRLKAAAGTLAGDDLRQLAVNFR